MAISFEKWLEIQLKTKGRADIDRETIINHYCFDPPRLWNYQLKELKIDWSEWKKLAEDHYNHIPEGIRAQDNEQQKIYSLHNWLHEVFLSEFAVISAYFREYYSMFGIYNRKYFERLVNDFRRHFPPANRHPQITYFDDLVCDLMADYQEHEKSKPGLTLEEIALIYFYNGETVTRENSEEKANVYGHNGGIKLYQHFSYYSKRINRRSKPNKETPVTLRNKIERFEKVIPYITDETGKETIMEDIRVLKSYID